jgi:hypothetical protein
MEHGAVGLGWAGSEGDVVGVGWAPLKVPNDHAVVLAEWMVCELLTAGM